MASFPIDEKTILAVLDWAYDKALTGTPKLEFLRNGMRRLFGGEPPSTAFNKNMKWASAYELAETYMQKDLPLEAQVDALVASQKLKCFTTGFVTGLGGLFSLPVTIPADVTLTFLLQLRMIAAIAHMGGYTVKDSKVQTLAYACLLGSRMQELLRTASIAAGQKLTMAVIKKIPAAAITKINQEVGFRLLTKGGEAGILNMTKALPVVGGLVSGGIDYVAAAGVSKVAKKLFIEP